MLCEAKTFYLKGGECTLAISKQRKDELVVSYTDTMNRSQAMFMTEYSGLNMKQIDELRGKVREAGGEFHIVKNTLGLVAFSAAGLPEPKRFFTGSTAIVFAFNDPPEMAKIVNDFARGSEFVKVKGGYLGVKLINADEVRALAELPPLPVVRSQLLGVLSAPAGKLVRTLAEPARQVAAVLKAYTDKDAAAAAA